MKREKLYDYIRQKLAERVGQHNRIAREAGIPQNTVSRIHLGKCMPRLDNAQKLLDYFEREERAERRSTGRGVRAARRLDAAESSATAPLGH